LAARQISNSAAASWPHNRDADKALGIKVKQLCRVGVSRCGLVVLSKYRINEISRGIPIV
jgi:hypothetical protein